MPEQHRARTAERAHVRSHPGRPRTRTAWAIDPLSPIPKYHQLGEILSELIATELEADNPIPSERELAERFGVARMTVRQAVNQLVTRGRLYRVPARGTYVARPTILQPARLTCFAEDMADRGLAPGSVALAQRTDPADEAIAAELGVRPGEPVHVVEHLRTADGDAMAIERSYLPAAMAPGLIDEPLADHALSTVLAARYGIVLDAGEQTIQAAAVAAADARLLAVPNGSPVLVLTRRSLASGVPVEYIVSTWRADRYQLHVSVDFPAGQRESSGSRISTSSVPGVPPGALSRTGVRP